MIKRSFWEPAPQPKCRDCGKYMPRKDEKEYFCTACRKRHEKCGTPFWKIPEADNGYDYPEPDWPDPEPCGPGYGVRDEPWGI